jgi:HEAT repeat protein
MPRQKLIYAWILIVVVSATALAQNNVAIRIMKAEDERRWDTDLKQLLASPIAAIRKRAALAAGRIGNEDSVSALAGLLKDADVDVRAMAAVVGNPERREGAADCSCTRD